MSGWIKLHRSLQDSAIASHPEYLAVWVHLMLRAQHSASEFVVGRQVVKLSAGQLVFGRIKFSSEIGVSENKVRAALDVMKSLNMITIKSMAKFSIISITKWQDYQAESPAGNQETASKSPALNQQAATYKNDKNDKNVNNDKNLKEIAPQADAGLFAGLDDSTTDNKKPTPPKFKPESLAETMPSPLCDWWLKWVDYRRARKLSTKEPTWRAQANNLQEWGKAGHDPCQAIKASIDNGWQGLFEPKQAGFTKPINGGAAKLTFTPTDYENGINPDGSF